MPNRNHPRRLTQALRLPNVAVQPLGEPTAKVTGVLGGQHGTYDPIDASVVLNARRQGHAVVTSDPDDLRRLDSKVRIVAI